MSDQHAIDLLSHQARLIDRLTHEVTEARASLKDWQDRYGRLADRLLELTEPRMQIAVTPTPVIIPPIAEEPEKEKAPRWPQERQKCRCGKVFWRSMRPSKPNRRKFCLNCLNDIRRTNQVAANNALRRKYENPTEAAGGDINVQTQAAALPEENRAQR